MLPLGLLENVCNYVLNHNVYEPPLTSASALCLQTCRAGVWPWLSSVALTARFMFYPACNSLMFHSVCQNVLGWKQNLLKMWLSIKIWSRTQTLQCLLLFFPSPVSLVAESLYGMLAAEWTVPALGKKNGMSDEPGAVNQRAVEDNLCVAGSCMLLKLE